MGACETTPHTSAGSQHATPDNPIATGPFLALNDLPPLAGVKLVRPRRCAAAGAPALTPGRAAGRPRAAVRKDPEEQLAQPGGARSHRARSVCPLDTGGPYGCRESGGQSMGSRRNPGESRIARPGGSPYTRAESNRRGSRHGFTGVEPYLAETEAAGVVFGQGKQPRADPVVLGGGQDGHVVQQQIARRAMMMAK